MARIPGQVKSGFSAMASNIRFSVSDSVKLPARHSGLSVAVRRIILNCVDRGWFGLTPLESHVVICGFPRAGSTLLHLMIKNCIADVRTFGKERNATGVAGLSLRNHRFLTSKRPNNIFQIDELRRIYETRKAKVRFVITLRDPRDVLISKIQDRSSDYHVAPSRWQLLYECFCTVKPAPDVLVIRYEDLVRFTERVEKNLTEFIGWNVTTPFVNFDEVETKEFDIGGLNGLRPVDPSNIGKWRSPEYAARMQAVLREIPKLPTYLVRLGYESDTNWTKPYLQAQVGS